MSITLTALMKQRYDTAANWTAQNPTLLAGEIGIESDTKKWKVGTGATAWTSLAYAIGGTYPIVNADIAAGAAIVDTKLATIATAGKVSNSATTATNTNTALAIVARDASGNFTAGTITAALTGAASSNVLKAGDTMTGVLAVTAGTAALPGIAVSGDPNTGIYRPGADQLAISTSGTEKLIVKSDGKVGIGDSAPASKLTVADSSALTTTGISSCVGISLQNTSNTIGNYTSIQNKDASGDQNAEIKFFNITQDTTLQGAIAFTTRSATGEFAEKMRLSPEGRLGIGTTSPTSLVHLADAGNITVGTTTGTKIGTATTQKLGFYNATPVVQPAAVANATTAIDVITQLNDLLAKLRTLGIIAT